MPIRSSQQADGADVGLMRSITGNSSCTSGEVSWMVTTMFFSLSKLDEQRISAAEQTLVAARSRQ